VDWRNPYEDRYQTKRIPARQCTQEDFGTNEKQKKVFSSWKGFSLLCPDLKEGEGFFIKGDSDSMETHSF
jgi:hypothetical protein